MPTALIAGASRGLGLELVRQYAADGWQVFAGCRDPRKAEALQAHARDFDVRIHALDTSSDASVTEFREKVGGVPIDVLICVAGVSGGSRQSFGDIDFSELGRTMNVNTAGPVRLAQAFTSNLSDREGSKLIAVSSRMGSVADTTSTEMMCYRISKAALNQAWKCVSIELEHKGVISLVIHPGWVATEMGGDQAPVTPERSVSGMRKVISEVDPDDVGSFLSFEGDDIPW